MSNLMTLDEFRRAVESEVGYKEGRNNSTKYGDWFADLTNDPYFAHAPYCAMGLSWCGRNVDGKDSLLGWYASTSAWRTAFKKKSRFFSTPRVGDLVFYTFSHVEFVRKVSENYIWTVGFNTSSGQAGSQRNGDGVYERTRARNSLILGYGRPLYAAAAKVPSTRPASGKVIQWQTILKFAPALRDGEWGPLTDKRSQWLATASRNVNNYQLLNSSSSDNTIRIVQRVVGAVADGVWGPQSAAKCKEWIKRAQSFLGVYADGVWGPKTQAAYSAFRRANIL